MATPPQPFHRTHAHDRVQVGVIGTSWWADQMYLRSLESHPQATVVALCGRRRQRAETLAQKYNIPAVYTDYRQMLEQAPLQAVVVASPDDLHHPMVMDALDAGLHVLCEKPMALTLAQAREMADRAEGAGVKHMVLFTFRGLPLFRYVRALIEEGYIGRCFHVQMHFLRGDGQRGEGGWRFDRQRSIGVLGSLGSHMIDMARWYVGDVAGVSANLATFIDRQGPDGAPLDPANDSAMLMLRFKNGAQGTIHVSAVANMGERGMEQAATLHGSAGVLEVVRHAAGTSRGEILGLREGEKHFQLLPVPDHIQGTANLEEWLDPFVKQPVGARLFIDAILNDFRPSPDFHDGLRVQEVIEAAIKSTQEGCWVTLP